MSASVSASASAVDYIAKLLSKSEIISYFSSRPALPRANISFAIHRSHVRKNSLDTPATSSSFW